MKTRVSGGGALPVALREEISWSLVLPAVLVAGSIALATSRRATAGGARAGRAGGGARA
jgi:hypothetical protein